MAQFARPDSNVTQTNMTGGFAEIDESSASDADFAYSANNTTAELEVGLSDVSDPGSSSGHIVRFRYAKTNGGTPAGGGTDCEMVVRLVQGTTIIASQSVTPVTSGTWTASSFTLTGVQADSITDYADLRLEFAIVGGGGSPANRRGVGISWAELETPDAAAIAIGVQAATGSGAALDADGGTPVVIAHRVRMNTGPLPWLRTGTPPSRIR